MNISTLHVIGVDPGPVPGIVRLQYRDDLLVDVLAFQCTLSAASGLLNHLMPSDVATRVQIEAFVVRRVAGKSGRAGAHTRNLAGALESEAAWALPLSCTQRSAGAVKPWATDKRLEAVKVQGTDLLDVVSHVGRHARDAARHALFCAVHDGGIPDPLSKSLRPAHQED